MTQDELDQLREGWDFEAKKAGGRDGNGALPESLWDTYSAFANTQGGKILLGAKERSDGTLELFGINDVARVTRDLWATLQNRNKVSANILKQGDVEELEVDGKHLLLISVPQAPREVRPVYLRAIKRDALTAVRPVARAALDKSREHRQRCPDSGARSRSKYNRIHSYVRFLLAKSVSGSYVPHQSSRTFRSAAPVGSGSRGFFIWGYA